MANIDHTPAKPVQTNQDIVTHPKDFVTFAADLTDEEASRTVRTILMVQFKYESLPNTPDNLEKLADELEYKLAEADILAKLDKTPCANGEPPIINILGTVSRGGFNESEFDHEKKQWEVRKAKSRGEDFLGQKYNPNSKSIKDRFKTSKSQIVLPNGS